MKKTKMKKLKFGSKAYRKKYLNIGLATFKNKKSKSRGKNMTRRKKSYSRNSGGMNKLVKTLIPAGVSVLYGAFSNDLQKKTPKIPKIENYSDNLIFGGGALAVQLFTSNKWANMITKPISDIELGEAGLKMRAKVPLSNGGSVPTSQNMAGYI